MQYSYRLNFRTLRSTHANHCCVLSSACQNTSVCIPVHLHFRRVISISTSACRLRQKRLVAKKRQAIHRRQSRTIAQSTTGAASMNRNGPTALAYTAASLLPARRTLHRTQIVVVEGPLDPDRRGTAEPGDRAATGLSDRHRRLPDPLHVRRVLPGSRVGLVRGR